ncbi:serine/arginine repetitive matrix protein 1-like isoform X2 [Belonocnema kinseyi]|uniref:serine/arginine repetitive matrix protein 1-like isoform X2 n=1 Tax=Belonocnema kinseyi TaxID=2817044 RepID=UPI00143CDF26|nr:serine/arginine repetitive matrix protein 1-like isoform X2 [Belonocnema kinseyi]XP_033230277.1 serine/arginine repetitive matrix protein 1-like isoform X2 [Belonocnema kinseyi]
MASVESVQEEQKGCVCKGNCSNKICGCVKKGARCTEELCKCNLCENRTVKKKPKSAKDKNKSSQFIRITENYAEQTFNTSRSARNLTKKLTAKDKLQKFRNPDADDSLLPVESEHDNTTLGTRSRKNTGRLQEESKRRTSAEHSLAKEMVKNSRGLRRSRSVNDIYQVAYNTRSHKKLRKGKFFILDDKNTKLPLKNIPMKMNARKIGKTLRKSASTSDLNEASASDLSKASVNQTKNVSFKTRKASPSEGMPIRTRSRTNKMGITLNFSLDNGNLEIKNKKVSKASSNMNLSEIPKTKASKKPVSRTRSRRKQSKSPNPKPVSRSRSKRNLSKSPNPKGLKKSNGSPMRKVNTPTKKEKPASKVSAKSNLSKSPNLKISKKPVSRGRSRTRQTKSPNLKPASRSRSKRNPSKSPNPKASKKSNGSPLRKVNSPIKDKPVSRARSRTRQSKSMNPKPVTKASLKRNPSKSPNPKGSKNPTGSPFRKVISPIKDKPLTRARSRTRQSKSPNPKPASRSRSKRNPSKSPNPKASKKSNGSPLRKVNTPTKKEKPISKASSKRNLSKSPNPKGLKNPNVSPIRKVNTPTKKEKPASKASGNRNLFKSPNTKGSKKPTGSPIRKMTSPIKDKPLTRARSRTRQSKSPNPKPASRSRSKRNPSKSPNPKASKKSNGSPVRKVISPIKDKPVSRARSRNRQSKSPNPKPASRSRSKRNPSKTPNPKSSKKSNDSPLRSVISPIKDKSVSRSRSRTRKSKSPNLKPASRSRSKRNPSKSPNPKASKKSNGSPLRKVNSPNKDKPVSTARSKRNLSKSPKPKGLKKPKGSPLRKVNTPNKKENPVSKTSLKENMSGSPVRKDSAKSNSSRRRSDDSESLEDEDEEWRPSSTSGEEWHYTKTHNPIGLKKTNGSTLRKVNPTNQKEKPVSKISSKQNISESSNPKDSEKSNASPHRSDASESLEDEDEEWNSSRTSGEKSHYTPPGIPSQSNQMDYLQVPVIQYSPPSNEESDIEEELSSSKESYNSEAETEHGQSMIMKKPMLEETDAISELSNKEESDNSLDEIEPGESTAKKPSLEEIDAIPSTSQSRNHPKLIGDYSASYNEIPKTSKRVLKRKSEEGPRTRSAKKAELLKFISLRTVDLVTSSDEEIFSPTKFSKNVDGEIFNSTEKAASIDQESDSLQYRERSTLRIPDGVNLARYNLSRQATVRHDSESVLFQNPMRRKNWIKTGRTFLKNVWPGKCMRAYKLSIVLLFIASIFTGF